MILLTPERISNAVNKNFTSPVKCKARWLSGDLFSVKCANADHPEPHRVRLVETLDGLVRGECDCECRRTVVCHHISAALALFNAIKSMRSSLPVPATRVNSLSQIKTHTVYDVRGHAIKVEKVRGITI